MPTVNFSPLGPKPQFELSSGLPAVGGQLFFYVGGSVNTKQNSYTDSTGGSANPNPVVLNSLGMPTNELWLQVGLSYKIVYAPAGDTDPPSSPIWSIDNLVVITGAAAIDQWTASGLAPTFVGATSFTLAGDQTTAFHAGRRIRTTNTGGTVYSTILSSVFGALTTVTVVNDSGAIDAGLSAVSLGLLTATDPSVPLLADTYPLVSGSADKTKKVRFEVDGLTTGTTRVITIPDADFTMAQAGSIGLPRGYIDGCILANNAGDVTNDIDFAAGVCRNSTNTADITCAALTKRLDAGWVAGTNQGMRNSAAAIANTTYHLYAVSTAAGVQDYYAHTSTVVATVIAALQAEAGGASYVNARRLGSIIRAAGAIVTFIQTGDDFWRNTAVLDVNANNPGAAAVTETLSVPVGIRVLAIGNAQMVQAAGARTNGVLFSDLSLTDVAPSITVAPLATIIIGQTAAAQTEAGAQARIWTSTAAQIRSRLVASIAGDIVRWSTLGWVDPRGQNA